MKNVIIGNGMNIKFGGGDYSNWAILNRLENGEINIYDELRNDCKKGHKFGFWDEDLTNEFMLKLIKNLFEKLVSGEISSYLVLKKGKDINKKTNKIKDKKLRDKMSKKYAEEDMELKKLDEIYKMYKDKKDYRDIGLEDYLFLIRIYSESVRKYNELKKYMIVIFNMLIFNKGKVNEVIYDNSHIIKLKEYENIFTLNYDNVIEKNLKRDNIYHLHGDFKTLDGKYNKHHPNGFKDIQIEKYDCMLSRNTEYYANTLYAFNGDDKYSEALGYHGINEILKAGNFHLFYKMLKKLDETGDISRSEDQMKNFLETYSENVLYEYYFDKLKTISGSIELLGISPNNDNHIVEIINNNEKIEQIVYYYYSDFDKESAKKIFNKNKLILKHSDNFAD